MKSKLFLCLSVVSGMFGAHIALAEGGAALGLDYSLKQLPGLSLGGRLGFGRAVLRLVGLAIGCLPLYVGLIWVAFDSRKRGWHDLIAGSVVIRRTR